MSTISKALCWAAVIIATALAKANGFISHESGLTMLIVLPVIAVLSLRGKSGCVPRHRTGEA